MKIEENANARFDLAEKQRKKEEEKEIRRERSRENGEMALRVYGEMNEEKMPKEEVFEGDLENFEIDGDRYAKDEKYREALDRIVLGVSKMKKNESETNEPEVEVEELSDEEINEELFRAREETGAKIGRENEAEQLEKKIEKEVEKENLEIRDELFDLIYQNAEREATRDLINEDVGGDAERVEDREALEEKILEEISGKGKKCWDVAIGGAIEKMFFQLGENRDFDGKFGLRREDFGEEIQRVYDPSKDATVGEGSQYWLFKDGGVKGETIAAKLTDLEEKIQNSWRAAELYAGVFGVREMGGVKVRELISRGKEFEENGDNDFRYEVAAAARGGIDPEKVTEFAPIEGTFLMEYIDRDFRTDEVEFSEGVVDITELARKSGAGYRDGIYLSIEGGIGEETRENIAKMLGTTLTEIRKKQGSMAIREKDGSVGVYYPATEVERAAARERQRLEDKKRREGETFGRANKEMESLLGKVLGW